MLPKSNRCLLNVRNPIAEDVHELEKVEEIDERQDEEDVS
jgi:hypothetical protein